MITIFALAVAYQMAVTSAILDLCLCIPAYAVTRTPAPTGPAWWTFESHPTPELPWPHGN